MSEKFSGDCRSAFSAFADGVLRNSFSRMRAPKFARIYAVLAEEQLSGWLLRAFCCFGRTSIAIDDIIGKAAQHRESRWLQLWLFDHARYVARENHRGQGMAGRGCLWLTEPYNEIALDQLGDGYRARRNRYPTRWNF